MRRDNAVFRRARLGAALLGDLAGAVGHALRQPSRHTGRVRLICFVDLVQDGDLLLPIACAARDSGRFDVRVIATHWLNYAAPHIPGRIRAAGFQAERPTRQAVLSGLAPHIRGWDALLTASESTSPSHRVSHALTQRAEAAGLTTFTMQHGLENVGLTYDGDGPHDFASRILFTWCAPSALPEWVASDLRARCIGGGRPKPWSSPAQASLFQGETRPIVAVFENLHWQRYDDSYRHTFVRDLAATARAAPHFLFVVKPHPAGKWLNDHAETLAPRPDNITIADAALSSDDLIARATAVITTPSTIALDAAQRSAPVAVACYGLDLSTYDPLPRLEGAADWRNFLSLSHDAALGAQFVARHVLPRDATADILTHVAAHAATPAPRASALQRLKTAIVQTRRRGLPSGPLSRNRQGGLATSPRHYQRWIHAYDTPSADELDTLRRAPNASVSVIIDERGAMSAATTRTEASLQRQTLAPHEILHARSEDLSAAAIAATGEFLCVVTSGDALAPHALTTLVAALREAPRAPFAYSDEDWLDTSGRRKNPYFKPDWSCDLFLAQDFVSRLALMRTEDVQRTTLGDADGADALYALLLRLATAASGVPPAHTPHVLLHRHETTNQATPTASANSGAAPIEMRDFGTRRITYPPLAPAPLVTLIVPTRDRVDLLRPCLESLRRADYPSFEIIVVDNQTTDAATLAYLRDLDKTEGLRLLHYPHHFDFAAINNFAAAQAKGAVIGLINNDIEANDPAWLREMVVHAVRPGVGAVGAMLLYPDGAIQHAGCVLGIGGVAGHVYEGWPGDAPGHGARLHAVQDVAAVTAACLIVRKEVWNEVGGLDRAFPIAYNDIDFCLRVRQAGHRILWTPHARLVHRQSASRGADRDGAKRVRLQRDKTAMRLRWGEALLCDPFYNSNLSLADTDVRLAFPPRVAQPWRRG